MQYYPAFLRLAGRRCLVVGGGQIALFKTRGLVKAGAHVTVVSPRFVSGFDTVSGIERIERKFDVKDLAGMRLAISATGDPDGNKVFRDACHEHGVLYCVTDVPEQCEFIAASLVERGDLTVAISSAGAAPALAKRLRRELEEWLPEGFEEYVAFLRQARDLAKERIDDAKRRGRLAADLASRESQDRFLRLGPDERQAWLDELLSEAGSP